MHRGMRNGLFALLTVGALAGCVTSGPLKTSLTEADQGYFSFPTSRLWKFKEINIGGELTFPEGSSGVVPLVMVVHSANGIDYSEHRWRRFWLGKGYAVFMLDYMSPRGVNRNSRDWPREGSDVLDALAVLATHPRIDSTSVAIQGLSNGGTVTVTAASNIASKGAAIEPKAYITLYGGCHKAARVNFPKGAGVLFVVGGSDDPVFPELCDRAAQSLRNAGIDAKAVILPGVYHGFDGNKTKSAKTKYGMIHMRPDAEATERAMQEAEDLLARVFSGGS